MILLRFIPARTKQRWSSLKAPHLNKTVVNLVKTPFQKELSDTDSPGVIFLVLLLAHLLTIPGTALSCWQFCCSSHAPRGAQQPYSRSMLAISSSSEPWYKMAGHPTGCLLPCDRHSLLMLLFSGSEGRRGDEALKRINVTCFSYDNTELSLCLIGHACTPNHLWGGGTWARAPPSNENTC